MALSAYQVDCGNRCHYPHWWQLFFVINAVLRFAKRQTRSLPSLWGGSDTQNAIFLRDTFYASSTMQSPNSRRNHPFYYTILYHMTAVITYGIGDLNAPLEGMLYERVPKRAFRTITGR